MQLNLDLWDYFDHKTASISWVPFSAIRRCIGELRIQTLQTLGDMMGNASRAVWRPSNVLCINELLAAYQTLASPLCRLIPQKPHPSGHLFYLLGREYWTQRLGWRESIDAVDGPLQLVNVWVLFVLQLSQSLPRDRHQQKCQKWSQLTQRDLPASKRDAQKGGFCGISRQSGLASVW